MKAQGACVRVAGNLAYEQMGTDDNGGIDKAKGREKKKGRRAP